MAKISFKGLDKLEKKLIQNAKMEEAKKVVRDNGLTLQGNVVKNAGEATFNKGYFTKSDDFGYLVFDNEGSFELEGEVMEFDLSGEDVVVEYNPLSYSTV